MSTATYISKEVRDKAPLILEQIKKADSILLHCHPAPDPDSLGSALAMRFALEQIGKKVALIKGDSDIPPGFRLFPGVGDIVEKNFFETELSKYDLFIILDSGSLNMISAKGKVVLPDSLNTVVIDHHASNNGYGKVNLIDISSPATAYILFQLFAEWGIALDRNIAINLFMGMYTDTGGFKYPPADSAVLLAAAECARLAPDYTKVIFDMENSQTKENIYFLAMALNSIETFCGDSVAISSVSNQDLLSKSIPPYIVSGSEVANMLKSVTGWNIGVLMTEVEPEKIKINFRSRDSEKYDVSKIAVALGGGGHRAAAGAGYKGALSEAKQTVVSKIKELYNLD